MIPAERNRRFPGGSRAGATGLEPASSGVTGLRSHVPPEVTRHEASIEVERVGLADHLLT
jgi:hypothetical protein